MKTDPSTHGQNPSFDPLSSDFAENPYPCYAALRHSRAFTYFPDIDTWLVSRFQDVSRIVMDADMVRSMDGLVSREHID